MDDPLAIRIDAFAYDLKEVYPWAAGYYDAAEEAIVIDYPSDTTLYIVHGFSRALGRDVSVEDKKAAWNPLLVHVFFSDLFHHLTIDPQFHYVYFFRSFFSFEDTDKSIEVRCRFF